MMNCPKRLVEDKKLVEKSEKKYLKKNCLKGLLKLSISKHDYEFGNKHFIVNMFQPRKPNIDFETFQSTWKLHYEF